MTFKLRQFMLKLFFEVPDYKIARRQRGRKAAHDLLDITLVNEVRCRNFWLRCAFPMFWMTNVLLESTDDLKRKIQKSSFFAGWLGNDVWFVFPICLSLAFPWARWKEVKETISLSPIRWPGLHLMDEFGSCLKGYCTLKQVLLGFVLTLAFCKGLMIDGMGGGSWCGDVFYPCHFCRNLQLASWMLRFISWPCCCVCFFSLTLKRSGLLLLDPRALNMDNWRTGDPNFERVENLGSLDTLLLCQQKMWRKIVPNRKISSIHISCQKVVLDSVEKSHLDPG